MTILPPALRRKCDPCHPARDPKEIHVPGEDEERTSVNTRSNLSEVNNKGGLINAGAIHGSVRLLGLGVKRERVDGDTLGLGHASVVPVGLVPGEVVTITLSETVLAVNLELARGEGVKTTDERLGAVKSINGVEVLAVGVLVGLEVVPVVSAVDSTVGGFIFTDGPDELHAGVVEAKLELLAGGGGALSGVLELSNKVFVGLLGGDAAFSGFKEDVVNPKPGVEVVGNVSEGKGGISHSVIGGKDVKVVKGADGGGEPDNVVLEGNKGERKTGVLVEPELGDEGNGGAGVGRLGGLETV